MAQSELRTTEQQRETGASAGLMQDLKALPDDIRAIGREAKEELEQAVRRNNRLDYMLDIRTALIAVAVTLVLALILWVIEVTVLIGTVIAVAALAIALFVVAEIRREPPPREPRSSQT
jgi:Flp pilus assembly protein TadB